MSQLVGAPCGKCQKPIASILAGEFCAACGNAVHNGCKASAIADLNRCRTCGCEVKPVAAPNPQAGPEVVFRPNKLSNKLIVGGIGAVVIGIWWIVDGLEGGMLEPVIGGVIWKGALFLATGIGAVYYGYRLMTDPGPEDLKQK